jgi:hypothetical protein
MQLRAAGQHRHRGAGEIRPLSGPRDGDRFAPALISLALDEVDATSYVGVSAETPAPTATAPITRVNRSWSTGHALRRRSTRPPAAELTIPFAAEHTPAIVEARDRVVALAITRRAKTRLANAIAIGDRERVRAGIYTARNMATLSAAHAAAALSRPSRAPTGKSA